VFFAVAAPVAIVESARAVTLFNPPRNIPCIQTNQTGDSTASKLDRDTRVASFGRRSDKDVGVSGSCDEV
jgi:hypothetical protein